MHIRATAYPNQIPQHLAPVCEIFASWLGKDHLAIANAVDFSDAASLDKLLSIASHHHVAQSLYVVLRDANQLGALPDQGLEFLQTIYQLNRERNQRIITQFIVAAASLNEQGIQPVLLKGVSHIMNGLYEDVGFRLNSDIDILVLPEQMPAAREALKSAGYMQPSDNALSRSGFSRHISPFVHPNRDAAIELHDDLARPHPWTTLPVNKVFADAVTTKTDGAVFKTLSPLDQLTHNVFNTQILNFGYHKRFVELRQLVDFVLLIETSANAVDWNKLSARFSTKNSLNALLVYQIAAEKLLHVPCSGALKYTAQSKAAWSSHIRNWNHPRLNKLRRCLVQIFFKYDRLFNPLWLLQRASKILKRRKTA